ncbi:MAG TPA: cytochrome c oxidase subunit 3 [Solirubrobacteraceae bacterium]|nr:cytochrome c oxidase subunit 3 [Solirubrobacteraceae bacterium]
MAASSENLPLRPAAAPLAAAREIPAEPPDVGARALSVASRLLCGATSFFFVAFVFAYFYLRSLDQDHMWRPAHIHPNQALGVAFVACLVASALASILAGRQMKASRSWLSLGLASLALGLAAVALQCVEYTTQHWGPTNGAYASVFSGWTAFYMIAVLATMFWLETLVATELRARRTPAHSQGDVHEPDRLIAPGLDAAVFYWSYLAAIGVLMYVILYPLQ